jgi:hypothetical protein
MDIDHRVLLMPLARLYGRTLSHTRLRRASGCRRGGKFTIVRSAARDLRIPGARRDGFFLLHVRLASQCIVNPPLILAGKAVLSSSSCPLRYSTFNRPQSLTAPAELHPHTPVGHAQHHPRVYPDIAVHYIREHRASILTQAQQQALVQAQQP